jgi:DNA-binding NarL/FixJ family response regulator
MHARQPPERAQNQPGDRDPAPVRVLVVDDHRLMRDGIRAQLPFPEFEIVAEAGTGQDALSLATRHRPDVVLLDLGLPDAEGADVCGALVQRLPGMPVIVLSARCDRDAVISATDAGALAYLLKSTEDLDLPGAIRTVLAGESVLDPRAARLILTRQQTPERAMLTPQELNVVLLVAEGLTNREIGDRLSVSPHTAKEYLSSAMRKLGETTRVGVVMHAARDGLLPPPA